MFLFYVTVRKFYITYVVCTVVPLEDTAVRDIALLYKVIYIYIYLAALGLRCCLQAFSSCGEWGLFFVTVCRLLIAVAPLVEEQGLYTRRLQ